MLKQITSNIACNVMAIMGAQKLAKAASVTVNGLRKVISMDGSVEDTDKVFTYCHKYLKNAPYSRVWYKTTLLEMLDFDIDDIIE